MGNTIGSMVDFSTLFAEEISTPPTNGLVLQYNTIRNSRNIKNIIFVEGSSDRYFYFRTNVSRFNDKSFYIYASKDDAEVGKEAVLSAHKYISNNIDLSTDIGRCIFLTDRDWDTLTSPKSGQFDSISLTDGHSMENYFLTEANTNSIFDYLGLKQKLREEFKRCFSSFARETAEFWSLKATINYAVKNCVPFKYRREASFDDIFSFEYRDNHIQYDKAKYEHEVELMNRGIGCSPLLLEIKDRVYKSLIEAPKYVRGHDAFHFLQCFLESRANFKLDFLTTDETIFSSIVHEFEIQMEIK